MMPCKCGTSNKFPPASPARHLHSQPASTRSTGQKDLGDRLSDRCLPIVEAPGGGKTFEAPIPDACRLLAGSRVRLWILDLGDISCHFCRSMQYILIASFCGVDILVVFSGKVPSTSGLGWET
jgi:hypothetical protein